MSTSCSPCSASPAPTSLVSSTTEPAPELLRGILGGSLFGVWILIAHGIFFDAAPKAHIPDPAIIHVAITTAFGALFGALAGRRRAKHERQTQEHTTSPP